MSIQGTTEHPEIIIDPEERWWCSHLNRLPAVRGHAELPDRVRVRDCSLREGEETASSFLTTEKKIAIARMVQEVGIEELEVGYCGAIQEHEDLARRLREEGITISLTSVNRSYTRDGEWQDEIDKALATGVDCIHFVAFCNDDLLASVPWLKREDVPRRIEACIRYAKQAGVKVGYALAGTTRTQLHWVTECGGAAAAAGADVIGVTDSMGCALPETIAFLVRHLQEATGSGSTISYHGHNTFGLATANALAAVRAGAEMVDTVPIGLGEGAGITALEELVFSLEVLYGMDTGLQLQKVADLARLVKQCFSADLPPTKTIIGTGLYRHSIDSHIASILRGKWHSWECIHPRVVGQERFLEFGHAKIRRGRSGAIQAKVEQMGYEADDEQLEGIIDRVREIAAKKRWATEADVERIIREQLGG